MGTSNTNGSKNNAARKPSSQKDTHLYCPGRRRPIDPKKATANDKKLLAQRSTVPIYNPDSHKNNEKRIAYGVWADNACPRAYRHNGQWKYW